MENYLTDGLCLPATSSRHV